MARTLRVPPTQDELKDMLREHLSFEINRFRLAASYWGKSRFGVSVDAMIREACLIHFRLLLDFFYPRIDPKDSRFADIFISDYLPNPPTQLQQLLKEPPWLSEYRNKLDWQLAHLTLERRGLRGPKKRWDASEQFGHMEQLIEKFLAAVANDFVGLYDPHIGVNR